MRALNVGSIYSCSTARDGKSLSINIQRPRRKIEARDRGTSAAILPRSMRGAIAQGVRFLHMVGIVVLDTIILPKELLEVARDVHDRRVGVNAPVNGLTVNAPGHHYHLDPSIDMSATALTSGHATATSLNRLEIRILSGSRSHFWPGRQPPPAAAASEDSPLEFWANCTHLAAGSGTAAAGTSGAGTAAAGPAAAGSTGSLRAF
jgi:hypothetical protein